MPVLPPLAEPPPLSVDASLERLVTEPQLAANTTNQRRRADSFFGGMGPLDSKSQADPKHL